jgi:hypothetical protein
LSSGYLPVLGIPLEHGPAVAAVAALAVMPGAFAALARLLERRWLRASSEFTAVSYGDPLLAVATGLGTWLLDGRAPQGVAGPGPGLVAVACWLAFGLVQWRAEVRSGFYSGAQAAAPTKIWHQLVVYPVLGYWLWTAGLGGLTEGGGGGGGWSAGRVAGAAALVGCVLFWVAANGWDRRHPKLGHPPYDWRRLRPAPRPWAPVSVTLRAFADRQPVSLPAAPVGAGPE